MIFLDTKILNLPENVIRKLFMKTTEQKEKELNGKRYKITSTIIESSKQKGEEISHEMEIDLHHAWMEMMN